MVIPLVVYASRTRAHWHARLDIADLLDTGPALEALGDLLPHFRYQVDDLNSIDLPTLLRRPLTPMARTMFVLQKKAPGNTALDQFLSLILTTLIAMFEGPHGINDLEGKLSRSATRRPGYRGGPLRLIRRATAQTRMTTVAVRVTSMRERPSSRWCSARLR